MARSWTDMSIQDRICGYYSKNHDLFFHEKVQEVKDSHDIQEPICHFRALLLANKLLRERKINSLSFQTNLQMDRVLKCKT